MQDATPRLVGTRAATGRSVCVGMVAFETQASAGATDGAPITRGVSQA